MADVEEGGAMADGTRVGRSILDGVDDLVDVKLSRSVAQPTRLQNRT